MEDIDEISGSLMKWCSLAERFPNKQRGRLFGPGIHCMFQIPPTMMRTGLIKFLVQSFNPTTENFLVNEKDLIYLTGEDIYTLFRLEDRGLDVIAILGQEGMDAKERIPAHWLNPKMDNLLTDDLIEDIVDRGAVYYEFMQKAILVLIRTMIAAYSTQITPKSMYALVENLERFPRLNWNGYTLCYTMEAIRMCKRGNVMRHWSKGNMAVIQVHLYI
jgi:hypothetical protein